MILAETSESKKRAKYFTSFFLLNTLDKQKCGYDTIDSVRVTGLHFVDEFTGVDSDTREAL